MISYKDILRKIRPPKKKARVWVLEKEKIAYIRIRKVASSSINLCLMQHIAKNNNMPDPTNDRPLRKSIEAGYSSHITHTRIREQLKGNYFIFAFVRNPLSRAYSCYRNKIKNPKRADKKEVLCNSEFYYDMDFAAFVDAVVRLPDDILDRHLRPQSWFLCDEQGLLPDFIGKLENFNADWDIVSDRYGLPKPIHWNKTGSSGKITDICPRASLEKLIERYAEDIRLFGYQDAVDNMLKEY
jgi:hypothetical protein